MIKSAKKWENTALVLAVTVASDYITETVCYDVWLSKPALCDVTERHLMASCDHGKMQVVNRGLISLLFGEMDCLKAAFWFSSVGNDGNWNNTRPLTSPQHNYNPWWPLESILCIFSGMPTFFIRAVTHFFETTCCLVKDSRVASVILGAEPAQQRLQTSLSSVRLQSQVKPSSNLPH